MDVIRRKSDSSFSNRLALAQCQEKMISDIFENGKLFWGGNYWPESATIPQQAPLQNEPVKRHVMKKEGVRLNKKQMKCEQHIV